MTKKKHISLRLRKQAKFCQYKVLPITGLYLLSVFLIFSLSLIPAIIKSSIYLILLSLNVAHYLSGNKFVSRHMNVVPFMSIFYSKQIINNYFVILFEIEWRE